MALPTQPAPSNESYGSLEYFQQELQSETTWRRLDAARNLADKAATNFERALTADYQSTLGVNAEDSEFDELMVQEVALECEALHAKILKDLQSSQDSEANEVKGYVGGYMSPVVALFQIATLENTDPFLDIATLEGDYSFSSLAQSTADGTFDKYHFNIDDSIDRQYALKAIMSESDSTLFHSQVRT